VIGFTNPRVSDSFYEELLGSRPHNTSLTSVGSTYDSVSRDRALQGVGREVLDHRASSSGG
jgi:hypothetical protein